MSMNLISLTQLVDRKEQLESTLERSEATHNDLKERNKVVKKEIANIKGAIIELERLIENIN